MTCDDGPSVTVLYAFQDRSTGTALGNGITNRGDRVKAWSGLHVLECISRNTVSPEAQVLCGDTAVPIN